MLEILGFLIKQCIVVTENNKLTNKWNKKGKTTYCFGCLARSNFRKL